MWFNGQRYNRRWVGRWQVNTRVRTHASIPHRSLSLQPLLRTNNIQESRFAASGLAQDRHKLALLDLKIHASQRRHALDPQQVRLVDILQLYDDWRVFMHLSGLAVSVHHDVQAVTQLALRNSRKCGGLSTESAAALSGIGNRTSYVTVACGDISSIPASA